MDGRDLRPALLEDRAFERELYWRTPAGDEAFRLGRWKYLHTKGGEEYLFDLEADPSETRNRASDATTLGKVKAACERLKATLPGRT